jgi:hypothetical protein
MPQPYNHPCLTPPLRINIKWKKSTELYIVPQRIARNNFTATHISEKNLLCQMPAIQATGIRMPKHQAQRQEGMF